MRKLNGRFDTFSSGVGGWWRSLLRLQSWRVREDQILQCSMEIPPKQHPRQGQVQEHRLGCPCSLLMGLRYSIVSDGDACSIFVTTSQQKTEPTIRPRNDTISFIENIPEHQSCGSRTHWERVLKTAWPWLCSPSSQGLMAGHRSVVVGVHAVSGDGNPSVFPTEREEGESVSLSALQTAFFSKSKWAIWYFHDCIHPSGALRHSLMTFLPLLPGALSLE